MTSLNPDGATDNFQPVVEPTARESFWRLFCCGTNKKGCCVSCCLRGKSIFERRPSSLQPLDGLRAIAVLLVIGCHACIFVEIDTTMPWMIN